MEARELIYRLLYYALLEIRVEAHEIQNGKIFHLADLFHNIPLQLDKVSRGEGSFDDVLSWLEQRASEKGCKEWLDKSVSREVDRK